MVAESGAGWAVCGVCGARLKQSNLDRHYAQVHPGQKQGSRSAAPAGPSLRVLLSFSGVYALVAGTVIFLLLFLVHGNSFGDFAQRPDLLLGFLLVVLVVALGMTLGADRE